MSSKPGKKGKGGREYDRVAIDDIDRVGPTNGSLSKAAFDSRSGAVGGKPGGALKAGREQRMTRRGVTVARTMMLTIPFRPADFAAQQTKEVLNPEMSVAIYELLGIPKGVMDNALTSMSAGASAPLAHSPPGASVGEVMLDHGLSRTSFPDPMLVQFEGRGLLKPQVVPASHIVSPAHAIIFPDGGNEADIPIRASAANETSLIDRLNIRTRLGKYAPDELRNTDHYMDKKFYLRPNTPVQVYIDYCVEHDIDPDELGTEREQRVRKTQREDAYYTKSKNTITFREATYCRLYERIKVGDRSRCTIHDLLMSRITITRYNSSTTLHAWARVGGKDVDGDRRIGHVANEDAADTKRIAHGTDEDAAINLKAGMSVTNLTKKYQMQHYVRLVLQYKFLVEQM